MANTLCYKLINANTTDWSIQYGTARCRKFNVYVTTGIEIPPPPSPRFLQITFNLVYTVHETSCTPIRIHGYNQYTRKQTSFHQVLYLKSPFYLHLRCLSWNILSTVSRNMNNNISSYFRSNQLEYFNHVQSLCMGWTNWTFMNFFNKRNGMLYAHFLFFYFFAVSHAACWNSALGIIVRLNKY